jgi:hypothetical protein
MKIDNEVFENMVHEIIKERGIKITKSIVPSTWRPYDMVIEVSKRIDEKENNIRFWKYE